MDLFSVSFYKKRWFEIAVIAILLLATFLRFYNYENRYALAGDQARDAIIALESVRTHKIPAVGPFSSVGNFTTGQTWYLWLFLSSALYPSSFLTPWVVLTASYVAIVFIMIMIGREIKDKKLGLILGLLTAVSPAQIVQSVNLTNPTLVALFSVLSLYFVIKYLKTGKNLFIFLFALFIGSAISTHFQAIYLLILLPISLILKKPTLKGLGLMILGVALPFISYLIFDIQNNFYNARGILDYVQYGQYKIYIPNRWITYATVFWPELWGRIVGGNNILGYLSIALVSAITIYLILKRDFQKVLILIVASFLIVFVALRYYRGERFDGYFIFLHPYVLVLTGWAAYQLTRVNRTIGLFLIAALVGFSIKADLPELARKSGYVNLQAPYWSEFLTQKYPGKQLEIYGYFNTSDSISLPLVLYMDKDKNLAENGYKIGFSSTNQKYVGKFKVLKGNTMGYEFWDLNTSTSAQLKAAGWHSVNPSQVYKSSAEWYKN